MNPAFRPSSSRQRRVVAVLLSLALLAPGWLSAQSAARTPAPPPLAAPIPRDPAVTIGTLPNGLRYYIRVNREPQKRAELRLVVNAGSLLEDNSQRGLAHLVEHMAFNGTKHFARKQLVDYLESTGVRFGADLNASTSFDETIYQLTVPTDSAKLLDTGIQILEDWAHELTFDPTELSRERGVVIEEWRLGRGAAQRIRDAQFPVLFAGSRYAERIPIGDKHTLETAPRDELVRFYRDWYRPDLMAVVAVGDFDKTRVERLIRERFSTIPAPKDARARTVYPVPDHDSTLVAITTDPEATSSGVAVYYMQPVRAERTVGDYRQRLVEALYNGMLNNRFAEITQRPDAPFLGALSAQGRLIRAKEVYALSAMVQDGGIARGLGAVLTEAERVAQHGFTATELEREKADLLRAAEQTYAERDKTSSRAFVSSYIDHYLEQQPIPSIAQDWELTRALLPGITVAEVNRVASEWLRGKSRVITVSAPQKDSARVPDARELLAIADSVARTKVVAYVDSADNAPLVPQPPAPGRIVARKSIPGVGVTEWTLSNGARVYLKPTTFKDDELLFRAFSPGGTSLAPDSLFIPARTASSVVSVGGVGGFSAVALEKALAGKSVNVGPTIGQYDEGVSGAASPRDADALLQLVYLYFTAPRPDSAAFLAYQSRVKAFLANRSASPESALEDTLMVTLAQHHPRALPITSAMFDQMDLRQSLDFYRDRFADASDFTFLFVGNIDTLQLAPLVETYIGGLPSTHRGERWQDVGMDYPRGVIRREVRKGTDPKADTRIVFTGPFDFTRANVYALSSLADVLSIRLRERLREQLGGTYGVGVSALPDHYPRPRYAIAVDFASAPDRASELATAVFAEIDSLKTNGPRAQDLEKVKETQLRERQTGLRRNGFWLSALYTYLYNGWDLREILSYPEQVKRLDAASVREAARRYLDERNYVQVTLYPEKQ